MVQLFVLNMLSGDFDGKARNGGGIFIFQL